MRLLMTTDTLGGVWTYCMELCAALGPHKVSIALATMGRALSPEQRQQVQSLPHVQLFESHYRLCWMQDAWDDVEAAGHWLLEVEQEFKPDLVQLNDLAHGSIAWQAPVVLVGHSCVFSWWEAVCNRLPPENEWAKYHQLITQSLQAADLVVAPSQHMLEALQRHYGTPTACKVIYNGRDFPAMAQEFDAASASENASTGSDKEPLIFAAGRIWDPAKNVGILSAVATRLPWPIFAAGEQQDPNGGSQSPDGITCLGFLTSDDVASWLARASVFVAPAHYEPFGLSILEAARSGCALVIADIPSLREVWGDAAVYVDPNDAEHICEVLNHLSLNPEPRLQFAQKAWQRAKRYTASRMAAEYLAAYQPLIRHSDSELREAPRRSVSGARS